MMRTRLMFPAVLLALVTPWPTSGQGVVVDEGRFQISVAGRTVGTEEFAIRRAGIGQDDAFFANAVVTRGSAVNRQEISPLLRATPPDGVIAGYQVKVTGVDELDFQMTRVGNRYVAVARAPGGDEEREFPARETSRILDLEVAHHYYFLRDAREGARIHVIEPRTRTQTMLTVERRSEDEIFLNDRPTAARRLEFTVDGQVRIAWYDRLGRVLRVEIPAVGYLAERQDLVG